MKPCTCGEYGSSEHIARLVVLLEIDKGKHSCSRQLRTHDKERYCTPDLGDAPGWKQRTHVHCLQRSPVFASPQVREYSYLFKAKVPRGLFTSISVSYNICSRYSDIHKTFLFFVIHFMQTRETKLSPFTEIDICLLQNLLWML